MKRVTLVVCLPIFISQVSDAQTLNWANAHDSSKHILGANVGWEYTSFAAVNYSYKLLWTRPVYLQTEISIPFGNQLLDDLKTSIGLSGLLFRKNSFHSIWTIGAVYKRYSSELVRINNLDISMKTINGFYTPKWFLASEVGFGLGLSTHLKHSKNYKEIIYDDVADGWYKPISAGILNIGLQSGYSFKKSDLIVRLGFYQSTSSSENVLIPFYGSIGYNMKIN